MFLGGLASDTRLSLPVLMSECSEAPRGPSFLPVTLVEKTDLPASLSDAQLQIRVFAAPTRRCSPVEALTNAVAALVSLRWRVAVEVVDLRGENRQTD